tara:strand:- start:5306 stop:5500 length:195 start_codon:yes stop_codon:yes gene_type:complete
MSISELKAQVEGLSLDERRQLTAYLVGLRHKELQEYRESLTAKINDASAENWVSFEEFDKRVSA